jgi:RNA polymerase sigma-70 factor (ECF subfamily)
MTDVIDPSRTEREQVVVRGLEPFGSFYHRERRSMVALAYATSKSRLAAEDIAQDAFMAAFSEWDKIGRLDNPATWVRRMVVNRSVSVIRRRIAAARHLARLGGHIDQVDLPAVSAETEHVWDEVRRLPRRQRQAVALRYVDQLSLAEIGEVLGCSKESVNTHLRRARSTLARRTGIREET